MAYHGSTVPFFEGIAQSSVSLTNPLSRYRSLAEEWESTVNPAMSTYRNPLGQISLFVLLDLLGSAGASVPSYFLTTHWAYQAMAHAEERLRGLGLLETDAASGSGSGRFLRDAEKKPSEFRRSGVEDDHIPFLRRGVPVLVDVHWVDVIPALRPPRGCDRGGLGCRCGPDVEL